MVRADAPDTETLVRAFVDRTLHKAQWTHDAHLRVGLWHVRAFGEAGAVERLRVRIRRYNEAVGTPNTDTSGYHETLTVFYVRLIAAFLEAGHWRDGGASPDAEALLLAQLGDRTLPLEYYSRERLFSPEARRAWVAPDLRSLP